MGHHCNLLSEAQRAKMKAEVNDSGLHTYCQAATTIQACSGRHLNRLREDRLALRVLDHERDGGRGNRRLGTMTIR